MSEVKQIKVSLIDPTSPVNVRRQGVEQNVDRIKMSIEKHGYMQLLFAHTLPLTLNTIISMFPVNVG